MYSYADQPTPPFNSPYQQHTSRTGSLLESPYPTSGQQESQPNYTHGLGLYEVHPSLPSGLPPSPQPSESWGDHYSHGTSVEHTADPYLSGAFDHPVSHSPVPWNSAQDSPSTSPSQYSPRAMSAAYSHDGSEPGNFSDTKLEAPTWNPAVHMPYGTEVPVTLSGPPPSGHPPLTVAPDHLSTNMYSYGSAYPSPVMPKYEPAAYHYHDGSPEQAQPVISADSAPTRATRPTRVSHMMALQNRTKGRNRRHTDPTTAAFHCELCPERGFQRRYNLNQHMLTHDHNRKKPNACLHPGCGQEFVRKTDLARHNGSVHLKIRPHLCSKCKAPFSRKDTLRRHEFDGCSRRNQVHAEDAIFGRSKL